MTENIIMERGKKAFENCQNIISLKSNIGKDFLKLAFLLITNHDSKYYEVLGYDTWEEFLAIPEISMSRSFAYKLMQVNRIWIEKYNVSQENLASIETEKLYLASTKATKDNYEEWLEKAKTLSRSDIKGLIKGEEYEYKIICPRCGYEFPRSKYNV